MRVDAGQASGAVANVGVDWERGGVEPAVRPRDADVDKAMGIRHGGRATEQQRVGDGEDSGVGADADREREHGRRSHGRIAPQHPHGILPIPPRVVEPQERAFVPVELLGPIDAAQREPRGAPGLVRRQAAAAILVLEEGEMRGELACEVLLTAIGLERGGPASRRIA